MPYLFFHRRGQELLHLDLAELVGPGQPLVVGSKRGNYVVPDAGIAPVQFEIALEDDGYRLTDLSGEKTEVNMALVDSVLLTDGAYIKLGGFALLFQHALPEGRVDHPRHTLADAFLPAELPKAL